VADDIKATDAGQRYAKALFDLADDNGALAVVEADLRALKTMLAESKDLTRLMTSPAFSGQDRAKGLAAVAAKAKLSPLTRKFLGLLAANGRAALLQSAIAGFLALSAKRRGVVAAEVTTALALTPAQQKGVAAALRTALGKDPELSTRVDPAILGGMKVRVGSRLFDASLKSRLDSLKFALKRA
jgi:F-type H+-transporting ATPase subunit delta